MGVRATVGVRELKTRLGGYRQLGEPVPFVAFDQRLPTVAKGEGLTVVTSPRQK